MADPDLIFRIANTGILLPWLLLIAAPRWSGTQAIVHSVFVPGLLGLAYAWLLANGALFGSGSEGGGFTTLEGVKALMSTDTAILVGWLHFLAFDLFVGAWIARDAGRRGINHFLVIPCLLFTLFAGPMGLVLYFVARLAVSRGGWSLDEQAPWGDR